MRTLLIATSLCLLSTAALSQSASRTAASLDTCFKLVRVTEANCSPSANDPERQECLKNARKMQRVCLELAGPQAAESIDRPSATAAVVSSDKPAEAMSPSLPASAPDKAAEPDKAVEPTPPVRVTGSNPAPTVAQAPGWTVSETSSPVDYSPLVAATIPARSETGAAPVEMVVRCRGRREELALRMAQVPLASRGREIPVAYQINDQPLVKSRWTASADGKMADYRGDVTGLLRSFSEDARLKIVISDGTGRESEAAFQLTGWNAIRDKLAAACMWASSARK